MHASADSLCHSGTAQLAFALASRNTVHAWGDVMRTHGVLIAVIIVVCAASAPAAASDVGGHGRPDFVPVKTLGGSTGGELLGQWWAQVLAIPAAENPLFPPSPARCLALGRNGKVLAMAGTARSAPLTCTIK